MAEIKMILKTNTNYDANMTADGTVAVTMHGAVTTANPGNYTMTKTVNNESIYETNKSEIEEKCTAFEEMVKAAANTENDEDGASVISLNNEESIKCPEAAE